MRCSAAASSQLVDASGATDGGREPGGLPDQLKTCAVHITKNNQTPTQIARLYRNVFESSALRLVDYNKVVSCRGITATQ